MASPIARKLRKNPTEAEQRLWSRLRRKQLGGHRFRRQVPMGRYVVDFICHDARLVVEVDGGGHAAQIDRDRERESFLETRGYRTVRFWNNEVLGNTDGVVERILEELLRSS